MKHFIPIEMDGKMVVIEAPEYFNKPSAKDYPCCGRGAEEYQEDLAAYQRKIDNATKLPTLPEHFAYWKSKEGVKISEESFTVVHPHPDNIRNKEPYAMPLDIYTSSSKAELIEQEAERYALFTHGDEDLFEIDRIQSITDFKQGANFALSLPNDEGVDTQKSDNNNVWEEVLIEYKRATPKYDRSIKRYNEYLKQHYKLQKK